MKSITKDNSKRLMERNMKGNDLVEHIEKCEECQALQDRIDSYEKKGEWNEAMLLIDKQIECFEAQQIEWEYIAEEQRRE